MDATILIITTAISLLTSSVFALKFIMPAHEKYRALKCEQKYNGNDIDIEWCKYCGVFIGILSSLAFTITLVAAVSLCLTLIIGV